MAVEEQTCPTCKGKGVVPKRETYWIGGDKLYEIIAGPRIGMKCYIVGSRQSSIEDDLLVELIDVKGARVFEPRKFVREANEKESSG